MLLAIACQQGLLSSERFAANVSLGSRPRTCDSQTNDRTDSIMITAQLLLLFAVTAPAQPEWIGTMAWVTGEVQIDRGENTYVGQQAAGVAYGDTFRTGGRGRTAIYLFDGAVVMLGAGTHVSLKHSADGDPEWFVERGEARVTAGDATRMIVHSRHAEALVHRTILRINVDHKLDHYLVEHGQAHVSTPHDRQLISSGQGVHASADGVIRRAAPQPHRWAVRPAAYRQTEEELLRTPGADKQVDPFADEETSTDNNGAGDIGPDDNGADSNGADNNSADMPGVVNHSH